MSVGGGHKPRFERNSTPFDSTATREEADVASASRLKIACSGNSLNPESESWAQTQLAKNEGFACGDSVFDLPGHVVWVHGEPHALRRQEVRLLQLLSLQRNRVVPNSEILCFLYERVPIELARARLKTLVADVRRRLGADLASRLRTAHGIGLVLYVNECAEQPPGPNL